MMSSGKFTRPCNSLTWFLVVVLIQLGLPRSAMAKKYTEYTRPPDYTGLFKQPPLSTGDKVLLGAVAVGGVAALVHYVSKKKNPPAAKATLSPTNLNFGQVPIGDSRNYVVQLTNDGAAAFQVIDVRFSSEAFSLAQPLELPYPILAADRRRIGINFSPGRSAAFSGTMEVVVVEAGKQKAKTLKVALRGKGLARLGAWAGDRTAVSGAELARFNELGFGIWWLFK